MTASFPIKILPHGGIILDQFYCCTAQNESIFVSLSDELFEEYKCKTILKFNFNPENMCI